MVWPRVELLYLFKIIVAIFSPTPKEMRKLMLLIFLWYKREKGHVLKYLVTRWLLQAHF